MTRALLLKELRECWPLAALAAVAAVYVLLQFTGWSITGEQYESFRSGYNRIVPFINDGFTGTVAILCGSLAALLGLKQTAWEDFRGTYRYLLYRPASHGRIIATKLAVGLSLVLLVAALLIGLYAIWAATPGNHGSPFYMSMTSEVWRTWLVLPLVYLSAFLSGLRPARWFGTRLAPLIAGGLLATVLSTVPWWPVTLLGTVLLGGLIVAGIFQCASTRDY